MYRVTIQVVPNLPLTSKQRLRFSKRSKYRNATSAYMSTKPGEQPEWLSHLNCIHKLSTSTLFVVNLFLVLIVVSIVILRWLPLDGLREVLQLAVVLAHRPVRGQMVCFCLLWALFRAAARLEICERMVNLNSTPEFMHGDQELEVLGSWPWLFVTRFR